MHKHTKRWTAFAMAMTLILMLLTGCGAQPAPSVVSSSAAPSSGGASTVDGEQVVVGVLTHGESHLVSVLVTEDKKVWREFHDGIFHVVGTMENQCVAEDLEIDGLARRIGVEDGIALDLEGHVLLEFVDPDPL